MSALKISLLAALTLVSLVDRTVAGTLEEARQALDDGLPQVAVHKIRSLEAGERARESAAEILGEALVRSGRPGEAIEILEPLKSSNAKYWLAEAYAAAGNYKAALENYSRVAEDDDSKWESASVIGAARMFRAIGLPKEGTALLKDREAGDPALRRELARQWLDSGHPEKARDILINDAIDAEAAYLLAWAYVGLKESAKALELLKKVRPSNAEEDAGKHIAIARCFEQMEDLPQAEQLLEKVVQDNPESPQLENLFWELDSIYAANKDGSDTELRQWNDDESEPARRELALFFLARNDLREGQTSRGLERMRQFFTNYPGNPLAVRARLDFSQSLLKSGNGMEVLEMLNKLDADHPDIAAEPALLFLKGQAFASVGDYLGAAEAFQKSAEESNVESRWYDAAIAAIQAGIAPEKNAGWLHLKKQGSAGAAIHELEFRQALAYARNNDARAEAMLAKLAEIPDMSARARLALAEWRYERHDFEGARSNLIRVVSQDPELESRKAALAIFLADTGEPGSEEQVIRDAIAFLRQYPGSTFEAEVRMKIGEAKYRKGDYQGARTAFDELTAKFPDSPLADKAQFLAAESMARSMDSAAMEEAIERYEKVAGSGSPLALRARLSQALLQNALQRPEEALGVFGRILSLNPDPGLRFNVLVEQGDTYFSLGPKDKENYRKAISSWQQIVADSKAMGFRRNQALAKIGEAYEKLGDSDAALSAYYDVISNSQGAEPEYFWYYRAGFHAGGLLEAEKRWKEAIVVYEKLAALDGPRSEEARLCVNRLRLENFLWDEGPADEEKQTAPEKKKPEAAR